MTNLTREARIYLALWRKFTQTEGEEKKFFFPTVSDAISFTRNMYRAIKPYRDMKLHDETLTNAIEKWALWHPREFAEGEAPYVMLRARAGAAMAENLAGLYGITEDDLVSPAERAAIDSVAKVSKDLQDFLDMQDEPVEDYPVETSTPFYTRD